MIARFLIGLLCLCFAAAAQATDYEVSGVSDMFDYYNGTYTEDGLQNGKPYFRKDEPMSWSGETYIFYDGGRWGIGPDLMMAEITNFNSSDTPPETGWENMMNPGDDIRVTQAGAGISYSEKYLTESIDNDGSFTQSVEISHNNFNGEKFSGSIGLDFVADGRVNVYNLPAGLTAKVIKQSDTKLKFYLEGQASAATQADNVTNVTLSFPDFAFIGSGSTSAENTSGSLTEDFVIQFRDEVSVGSTGDHTTIAAAISAAQPFDILRVEEGVYTEYDIQIGKNIAIVGAGAGKTIVQADTTPGNAPGRVFSVSSNLADVVISDVTIQNGYEQGNYGANGGGIYAQSFIVLQNCHITNNMLLSGNNSANGGGINAIKGLRIENCLVDKNTAEFEASREFGGGGVYFGGQATIINSTFTDNELKYAGTAINTMRGGAIAGNNASGLTMVNSTVVGNSAPGVGGGVALVRPDAGTYEIVNSIITGNASPLITAEADLHVVDGSATINIRNSITAFVSPSGGSTINLTDTQNVDPMFDNFGNYGGNTSLFALTSGSPAIGAGLVTDDVPDLDQRGYSRSNNPDIGAYQYDGTLPVYVTYHANGGSGDEPELGYSLSEGKSFTVSGLDSLSRADHTFNGWNTEANGSGSAYVENDSITLGTADVDLYAQWTPDVVGYTLSYTAGAGGSISGDASQTVEEGTDGVEVTAVADTGYSFADWSDGVTTAARQDSNITADLSVTAGFERNEYTVTFVVNGTEFGQQQVLHGDSASDPGTPSVTGYTFTGWNTDYSAVTSDLTVVANLSINSYPVSFFDHLGNLISTVNVNHGSAANAPDAPTRNGYNFSGWSVDISTVTSALDATAQYDLNSYTVTFADHDGSVIATQTVEYQSAATAPADPARSGYTFTGWSGSFSSVTGDVTITAQYSVDSYVVTFADHDGTVIDTQSVAYQSAASAPTDPIRSGYTFKGWNGDFSSVTGDVTVTAQYTRNTYTVAFVDYDGSTITTETVEYQSAATAPADPTRSGYTFTGWSGSFSSVTGDVTITAQYSVNSYVVTFADHDGSVIVTQSVEYQSAATAPEAPVREGYTFTGWDTAFGSVTGSLTVTAQYEQQMLRISFWIVGEGTVSPEEPLVNWGQQKVFTITPANGYRVESVQGCGITLLEGQRYQTEAITADCELAVKFSRENVNEGVTRSFLYWTMFLEETNQ
ncbi:InlB B-repeat-containing protein [Idiomarina ramblicola]|nr:InlB B-repeat-containing protein [Idiomarina ramblicola]